MTPFFTLKGKNILITGGSMGIGLEAARICLQHQANVLICARNPQALEAAALSLKSQGYSNVLSKVADATSEKEIGAAIDAIESAFGPLSGTIHAAGIYGAIGPITQVDPAEWFEAIRINLFGSFLVARLSCLRLQAHGGGRLVLFSGGGAAGPFPNYTSYACSKAAVVRLTDTLAQEMAPFNIEANCVGPGFVITRLHQQTLQAGEKAGTAFVEKTKAEIAKGGIPIEVGATAAAFLVSDAAQGISGKFIAAPYDSWKDFPQKLKELKESDIFTLRRIVPKDRGMAWQ